MSATPDLVRVEVAASALEASIAVDPGLPIALDSAREVVDDAIATAGVVAGISLDVVERAAAALAGADLSLERTVLAVAEPPTAGRPAELIPSIDLGIQPGVLRDDGTVDYRDRSVLTPVESGVLVATFRPAVPPIDGTGVDGSALAPPALEQVALALGPGVERDEAGRVVATRSGAVKWDGAMALDVVSHITHEGDVDLSSGHLRMDGDVTVNGTVQRGFAVRATGDVEVRGDVDGGSVIAGGDVQVGGVIIGDAALVSAGGHITARRAQNAVVRSRGRVELAIDAIDATTMGAEVAVTGIVRGGKTEAETTVEVKDAGGASVGAWLSVGNPPEWPDDTARAIARQAVAKRREAKSDGRRSRGGAKRRSDGVARAANAVRQAELRVRQKAAIQIAHVDVAGTANEGVTVQVGDRRRTLLEPMRRVRFRLHPRDETIITEELP